MSPEQSISAAKLDLAKELSNSLLFWSEEHFERDTAAAEIADKIDALIEAHVLALLATTIEATQRRFG